MILHAPLRLSSVESAFPASALTRNDPPLLAKSFHQSHGLLRCVRLVTRGLAARMMLLLPYLLSNLHACGVDDDCAQVPAATWRDLFQCGQLYLSRSGQLLVSAEA